MLAGFLFCTYGLVRYISYSKLKQLKKLQMQPGPVISLVFKSILKCHDHMQCVNTYSKADLRPVLWSKFNLHGVFLLAGCTNFLKQS